MGENGQHPPYYRLIGPVAWALPDYDAVIHHLTLHLSGWTADDWMDVIKRVADLLEQELGTEKARSILAAATAWGHPLMQFLIFHGLFQNLVTHLIRKYPGLNEDWVRNAVTQAFEKLFRPVGAGWNGNIATLVGWLTVVASRELYAMMQKDEPTVFSDLAVEEEEESFDMEREEVQRPWDSEDPDESRQIMGLMDALRALKERHPKAAQVLEMKFFEGRARRDIAHALETTIGEVMRLEAEALDFCRQHLEDLPLTVGGR